MVSWVPRTYEDVVSYMSSIAQKLEYMECEIEDGLNHGFGNLETYQEILAEVLKDKPKRVVDIGSNLNQYAFLFTNEGIQYIGIDIDTNFRPITYDGCIFIASPYEQVREWFKDDVIISNLCVGFFIKPEDVWCKKLILGQDVMSLVDWYRD